MGEAGDALGQGETAESLATAAADQGAVAIEAEPLTRQSTALDRSVVSAVFSMPRPVDGQSSVRTVVADNGDRLAVRLTDVDAGKFRQRYSDVTVQTA